MHNWDGKELKTEVVPAVTLEDYPAQALKQLGDLKDDITGVATGRTACDRPLSWALVHYLANRHAARCSQPAATRSSAGPSQAMSGCVSKVAARVFA